MGVETISALSQQGYYSSTRFAVIHSLLWYMMEHEQARQSPSWPPSARRLADSSFPLAQVIRDDDEQFATYPRTPPGATFTFTSSPTDYARRPPFVPLSSSAARNPALGRPQHEQVQPSPGFSFYEDGDSVMGPPKGGSVRGQRSLRSSQASSQVGGSAMRGREGSDSSMADSDSTAPYSKASLHSGPSWAISSGAALPRPRAALRFPSPPPSPKGAPVPIELNSAPVYLLIDRSFADLNPVVHNSKFVRHSPSFRARPALPLTPSSSSPSPTPPPWTSPSLPSSPRSTRWSLATPPPPTRTPSFNSSPRRASISSSSASRSSRSPLRPRSSTARETGGGSRCAGEL